MWGGQMALWERQTVAGRLLAPERVLPYPGPALLSPEDKAGTVFPRSCDRPTLPRQQLSTTWLGTPFCCARRRPAIRFLSQQFPLSAVAARCPLVSKAPAWHPAKRWSREGPQQ